MALVEQEVSVPGFYVDFLAGCIGGEFASLISFNENTVYHFDMKTLIRANDLAKRLIY